MKRLLAITLLLLGVAYLPGCLPKTDRSGKKTIGFPLDADVKGFDPAQVTDAYAHVAVAQIFQPLLQYKHLVRPFELEPCLAESMPTISSDQLVFTIKIRPKVYFHNDAVFGGKKRPLKASDVVFTFQRIADPHSRSPNWWMFEEKIEGLDDFRKKAEKLSAPIDYSKYPVSGLSAPDDQTVVIRLKKPYRQLLYILAMSQTSIVAPEVVSHYGEEFLNHPVGTGPFILKEWIRGQKIRFARNPNYWDERYPSEGEESDRKEGRLDEAGKKLPFADEVTLWIYVEPQTRWLNFLKGNLDLTSIPKEGWSDIFDAHRNVKTEITAKGIKIIPSQEASTVFWAFNMEDPLVGKNVYLRKAISAAIDRPGKIELFYNGRAIEAKGPVPPGLFGYDPDLKNPDGYNLQKAKELMSKAREQYRSNGGKGEIPPIVFESSNSTVDRQIAELVTHEFAKIGLTLDARVNNWPQLQEKLSKKQVMFFSQAWNADYPDPENFFQLFYSKNVSPGPNKTNFSNPEFDRLYEKMRDLPDGPERKKAIDDMVKILHADTPWIYFAHRIAYSTMHGWARNFKRNPFFLGQLKYIDIDLEEKAKLLPKLR